VFIGATLTQQSALLEHHTWLARTDIPLWLATVIFLGTWLLMLAAMMGVCFLDQFRVVVQSSRTRGWRAWTIQLPYLASYLLLWSLFGLVAFGVDLGRLRLMALWSGLAAHAWAIGVGLVAIAALYQFMPGKHWAVQACGVRCAPAAVARSGGAWRAGCALGWVNIRSDGALMLIMFGVGMANLVWLIILTLIMTIEHLAPWRLRAVSLAGTGLAVVATLWGLQATTLPLTSEGPTQQQTVGMTQVTLHMTPAAYGPNTLAVTLALNGLPVTDATVSATLSMLDMDMGQQTVSLTPQPDGSYATAVTLSMPGHWQVAVEVQTKTGAATATFVVLAEQGHAP
jgi:predicted metal-binding membrane protein